LSELVWIKIRLKPTAKFIRLLRGGRKRASENFWQAEVDVMRGHNINLCLGFRGVFRE
jgi:hypothetical protein